jgi:hemerythrin
MPYFAWVPEYSVGVKELDNQHQTMVGILNRLHEAMKVGKASDELLGVITEMVNYTKFHFTSEEKILTAAGYPAFAKQKAEHEAFVKKVLDFQSRYNTGKLTLSIEVISFLKEWWSGHILGEDKKYSAYLNSKGVK